jgi:hypothetical protein
MAKVYVSSTIADLKRERRAVMDWLVAVGHQPGIVTGRVMTRCRPAV